MWWLLAATSTTTSGPAVDVSGWAARLIVVGALAASAMAVFTLWRKVFAPSLRKVFAFEEYWPILEKMAAEFEPNGGGSLRDQVDLALRAVSETTHLLQGHLIEKDERVERDRRFREDILKQLDRLQGKVDSSDATLHKRLRDLINGLRSTTVTPDIIEALLQALDAQGQQNP